MFSGFVGFGVVHQKNSELNYKMEKSFEDVNKRYKLSYQYSENNISIFSSKTNDYKLIGLVPMIGIGIPLIIPIGYNNEYFYLKKISVLNI